MNLKNFPKKLDSKTSCLRITVPENLDLALEGLIRKVLREQPKIDEIYSFAADYFETLLKIRDKTGVKYTSNQLCPFHNDENAHEMIKIASSFAKPYAKTREPPPKNKNKKPANKKETEAKKFQRKLQTLKPAEKVTPDSMRKSQEVIKNIPEINEEEFLTSDPIKELVEKELMETTLPNKVKEVMKTAPQLILERNDVHLEKPETTTNETRKLPENTEKMAGNKKTAQDNKHEKIEEDSKIKKSENVETDNNNDTLQKITRETNRESDQKKGNAKTEAEMRATSEDTNMKSNEKTEEKPAVVETEDTHKESCDNTEKEKITNVEAELKTNEKDTNKDSDEKAIIVEKSENAQVRAETAEEETNKENNDKTKIEKITNIEKYKNAEAELKITLEKTEKESNEATEKTAKVAAELKTFTESTNEKTNGDKKTKEIKNEEAELKTITEGTNKESNEKTETEEKLTVAEDERETVAGDTHKESNDKTKIEEITTVEKPEDEKPEPKTTAEETHKESNEATEEVTKMVAEGETTAKKNKNTLQKDAQETNKQKTKTEEPTNEEAERETTAEETEHTFLKSPAETNKESDEKREETASERNTDKMEAENKTSAEETNKDESQSPEDKTRNLKESIQNEEANSQDKEKEEIKKESMKISKEQPNTKLEEKEIEETTKQLEKEKTQPMQIKKSIVDDSETKTLTNQEPPKAEDTGKPNDMSKSAAAEPDAIPAEEKNVEDKNNGGTPDEEKVQRDLQVTTPEKEANESGNRTKTEDDSTQGANDLNESPVEEGDLNNNVQTQEETPAVAQTTHTPLDSSIPVTEVKPIQEEETESQTGPKDHPDTGSDKTEEPRIVVDSRHIPNAKAEGAQNSTEPATEELCTVVDTQHISSTKSDPQTKDKLLREVKDVQHAAKDDRELQTKDEKDQTGADAQSTTGNSFPKTTESPHIKIEEVDKAKETGQPQGEIQIKTIQTHYYNTLQVPEVVTKEFRLHSVTAEAMNTLLNLPSDGTKEESLEESPIDVSFPDLKSTSSSSNRQSDDVLMTPTSGYSLDLSELSWQTVTGLFLDSEKRHSSSGKPTEDRQAVEDVFYKTVIPSKVKAVPIPPRDAQEETNEPTRKENEKEEPETESSEGSSNNGKSTDSDVPFISVKVKTVIETQILDGEDEKKDEGKVEPEVEVQIKAIIDITDKPEVLKEEMSDGEKTEPKPSLEAARDKSDPEGRRENNSMGREGSSNETDSTLSSAATEIKRSDSGRRNLNGTRSLLSTQSLDYRKRNPLLKTRSLSTFRYGVTDFEVWNAIEKELEEAATKIQSKFRGYKTRKKLQRENAVQITTEDSSMSTTSVEGEEEEAEGGAEEKAEAEGEAKAEAEEEAKAEAEREVKEEAEREAKAEEEAKGERQQSTGEFHDSIVLSEHPR